MENIVLLTDEASLVQQSECSFRLKAENSLIKNHPLVVKDSIEIWEKESNLIITFDFRCERTNRITNSSIMPIEPVALIYDAKKIGIVAPRIFSNRRAISLTKTEP
jgi:hypothetical protein